MTVTVFTALRPGREDLLESRCIPSIQAQSYGDWRHLVIGDQERAYQPPPDSRRRLVEAPPQRSHDPWVDKVHFGRPYLEGEYVAILNDDDEWLPHHLETHLRVLEETGADFSWSQVEFFCQGKPEFTVGNPSFQLGGLDASGVVVRSRLMLEVDVPNTPEHAGEFRWLEACVARGARGAHIPELTARHHDGWVARLRGLPY